MHTASAAAAVTGEAVTETAATGECWPAQAKSANVGGGKGWVEQEVTLGQPQEPTTSIAHSK
jgi:hypothetical protein